jgi:hypothetical protein
VGGWGSGRQTDRRTAEGMYRIDLAQLRMIRGSASARIDTFVERTHDQTSPILALTLSVSLAATHHRNSITGAPLPSA